MEKSKLKQDIIADEVRSWIAVGKYAAGDKLPSDIELAEYFKVNKCTIGVGLKSLVEEGLIDRAPKRGTVVKKGVQQFRTNSVALILPSSGDFYSDMARYCDKKLQEKDLFPTLINKTFYKNHNEIVSFINRMNTICRPYGYLIVGETAFPYDFFEDNPARYNNAVFILRYHHHKDIPGCRYVLIDYAALGRMVVEYFAKKDVKHILFPAMPEKNYTGIFSSLQVQIFDSIKKVIPKYGITLDEGFFWRTHSGAAISDLLPLALDKCSGKTGIYCWLDTLIMDKIMPQIAQYPIVKNEIIYLGTFNTHHAGENHFASFDLKIEEIINLGIDMLTGSCREQKILLDPQIIEHPIN